MNHKRTGYESTNVPGTIIQQHKPVQKIGGKTQTQELFVNGTQCKSRKDNIGKSARKGAVYIPGTYVLKRNSYLPAARVKQREKEEDTGKKRGGGIRRHTARKNKA